MRSKPRLDHCMKRNRALICALIAVATTYPLGAHAGATYVAQTQQPTVKLAEISTGTMRWQCQGTVCRASGATAVTPLDACRALAARVGWIRSFVYGNQQLSGGELTQCNTQVTVRPSAADKHKHKPATVTQVPLAPVPPVKAVANQPGGTRSDPGLGPVTVTTAPLRVALSNALSVTTPALRVALADALTVTTSPIRVVVAPQISITTPPLSVKLR